MTVALLVLVGTGATAAVAGYSWARGRRPQEEKYVVFRCPRCEQKLRCRAEAAGLQGMCPRCMKSWTLPGASEAPASRAPGRGAYRLERRPVLR
jgi:hypothetical protein